MNYNVNSKFELLLDLYILVIFNKYFLLIYIMSGYLLALNYFCSTNFPHGLRSFNYGISIHTFSTQQCRTHHHK